LATALLLGACSSDPAPKEPDPSRPTTNATTTPTVAVPTMPPQASEDSPEGAAAFVKHYVDVFNYAAATGDVKELSRLSAPDCKGCQSYIDLYRDTYEAGGYFKGGDWKLGEFQVRPGPTRTTLFATVTSDPGSFRTDAQSPPEAGNAENSKLTFVVQRLESGWSLATMELQAS
jgi:hypothetical protein